VLAGKLLADDEYIYAWEDAFGCDMGKA